MRSVREAKSRAKKLRAAVASLGCKLQHSESLEVVSRVEGYADWNTCSAALSDRYQGVAEEVLDELLEAEATLSYELFTKRAEKQFLVHFSERKFLKDMRNIREDLGEYVSREYLGSLLGERYPDDDQKYPDCLKHVWRGVFARNEVLIVLELYRKNGKHYLRGMNYR